jgi:hypothetical protein
VEDSLEFLEMVIRDKLLEEKAAASILPQLTSPRDGIFITSRSYSL